MKLYSIQTGIVSYMVKKNVYRANWFFIEPYWGSMFDEFEKAYSWLMKECGYTNPPIWAWDSKKQIEYFVIYKEALENNISFALLELEVPDYLVTKTDFVDWHFVLNDWFLGDEDEEEKGDLSKEESWKRIFVEQSDLFQYTFQEIRPEYVIKTKILTKGFVWSLYKFYWKSKKCLAEKLNRITKFLTIKLTEN